MKADEIRPLVLAEPFRPFVLIMNDGRRLPVEKWYYLGMSDDGVLLVHSSLDGGFETFGPDHVQDIDFRLPQAKRAKPRRNGHKKGAA